MWYAYTRVNGMEYTDGPFTTKTAAQRALASHQDYDDDGWPIPVYGFVESVEPRHV